MDELIEEAAIQLISLNREIISIESNGNGIPNRKKMGVSATLTQSLFGKVVYKVPPYSGGIFFNLYIPYFRSGLNGSIAMEVC